MRNSFSIIGTVGILLIGGCASHPLQQPESEFLSEYQVPERPLMPANGSTYQANYGLTLFEDVKAYRVGDLITVVLAEQTNASKSASTNTSKDHTINVDNPTLFGKPYAFQSSRVGSTPLSLEMGLESSKSFSGEGESAQSNALTGSITATVTEVLPNGYLRIRGEKIISLNQGDEYVRLTGIVRPSDISASNAVPSTLVANARISYGGAGVLAESNEMGWLARFLNGKWWPF